MRSPTCAGVPSADMPGTPTASSRRRPTRSTTSSRRRRRSPSRGSRAGAASRSTAAAPAACWSGRARTLRRTCSMQSSPRCRSSTSSTRSAMTPCPSRHRNGRSGATPSRARRHTTASRRTAPTKTSKRRATPTSSRPRGSPIRASRTGSRRSGSRSCGRGRRTIDCWSCTRTWRPDTGGAAGRFDRLKETALVYGFVLQVFGTGSDRNPSRNASSHRSLASE